MKHGCILIIVAINIVNAFAGNGADSPVSSDRHHSDKFRNELSSMTTIKASPFLLRFATNRKILSCFGMVFRNKMFSNIAASTTHNVRLTSEHQNDPRHMEADTMFYGNSEAKSIDTFISHVWSSPWWAKGLALLFYTNCNSALFVATWVWMVNGVLCVVYLGDGHYDALGGMDLTLQLVHIPAIVFFVMIAFGHVFTGCITERQWWLDKLCIHQSRDDIKVMGVTALPEFVAASTNMVILWSEDYFERLWCCAEVATFAALKHSTEKLVFLPLWLPQWILCTIAADMISATLWNHFAWMFPWAGTMVMEWDIFPTDVAVLVGLTIAGALSIGIAYFPACFANFFAFRQKVVTHRKMVHQISTYSLRDAKCTIESDREIVEAHVGRLFLEARYEDMDWEEVPAEAKQNAIDDFDQFVRTDLLESITKSIGHISTIPYTTALLVFLPLNFESYADVLGCDFGPCDVNAPAEGYASIPAFMLGMTLDWVLSCTLVFPSTYPLMLWGLAASMDHFEDWPRTNAVLCMIVVLASYFYTGVGFGLVCGFVSNAFTFGLKWIIYLVLFTLLLIAWNYYLFSVRFRKKYVLKKVDPASKGLIRGEDYDSDGSSISV